MLKLRKLILAALLLCAPISSVMAQGTISAMTAASALTGTELFECVQSGSKKCTADQIKTFTSASPTLVTPNIGTPSAGVLTNTTGYTVGALSGAGTGVLTALGVSIGSAGAPVLFNGAGGTPSSLTGTNITGIPPAAVTGTAAILTGNAFTGSNSTTLSIAATSTDGAILQNTTAAAAGAQQWSPRLRLTGQGWKTNATAASQSTDWIVENVPVQGAANPTSNLVFSSSINGGAYAARVTLSSAGQLQMTDGDVTGLSFTATGTYGLKYYSANDAGRLRVMTNGSESFAFSSGSAHVGPNAIGWGADFLASSIDLLLRRSAAATLQQGAANAASPVAQTLQAQGSRSGTDTDVAGASYTIRPGAGTGAATPASLILATYVPVASGTGAQTSTAALMLSNSLTLGSHIVTPASSGTRYLCISTAGVVTSSASACSGT